MSGRTRWLPVLLVLLAPVLVYLPSLGGGYVYDDHRFVRLNPAVRQGAPLPSYFTDPATQVVDDSYRGLYRPLRTISFRVVAAIADGPAAQRVASLLLHLLNGILLFLLLRRLLGAERLLPPLIGACAFLLHPLATESVAWISSRGDLLAMTGILGGLLLYLARFRFGRVLSLLCFALGLLAKESAVVLPLLMIVVDGFRGGRRGVRAALTAYVPFAIVLVLYLGARYFALGRGGFGQRDSVEGILAAVLAGETYYVSAALFPWWLTFELDLDATAVSATLGFFVTAALLVGAVLSRESARPVALAILWFLAALVPVTVLQLLFPLRIEVANRFAYPALAGFGILLATASTLRRPAAVLSLVVLAAFVPLSAARAATWHDERSLWAGVLRDQPGHSRALYGLGFLSLQDGDYTAARERLMRAARTTPDQPKLAVDLGRACQNLLPRHPAGSPDFLQHLAEARSAYEAAVALWARGAPQDRGMFRQTALEAAWLAMVAGDPDRASANAQVMLQADGSLTGDYRTLRHLSELSTFLLQVNYPNLAEAVEGERESLKTGMKR